MPLLLLCREIKNEAQHAVMSPTILHLDLRHDCLLEPLYLKSWFISSDIVRTFRLLLAASATICIDSIIHHNLPMSWNNVECELPSILSNVCRLEVQILGCSVEILEESKSPILESVETALRNARLEIAPVNGTCDLDTLAGCVLRLLRLL